MRNWWGMAEAELERGGKAQRDTALASPPTGEQIRRVGRLSQSAVAPAIGIAGVLHKLC